MSGDILPYGSPGVNISIINDVYYLYDWIIRYAQACVGMVRSDDMLLSNIDGTQGYPIPASRTE